MPLSLPPEQLEQVFPFHFAVDRHGRGTPVGRGLRKLVPAFTPGAALDEHFAVARPALPSPGVAAMLARAETLFLLQARSRDLKMRGQVLASADEGLLF